MPSHALSALWLSECQVFYTAGFDNRNNVKKYTTVY